MIAYNLLLEQFKSLIKSNDLKYTKQRELIVKFLYENDGHYTPEEISMELKKQYSDSNIGIATIYRTLSLLEDAGIVTSISFGVQGKKYEFGLKKHHDHLVCTNCGHIEEFYDETIEHQQHEVAKKFGFRMTGHNMKIMGICKVCQAKQLKKEGE
jgi:Fur family ferric uptake transcriptional regulator